jgi:hypothetical protein
MRYRITGWMWWRPVVMGLARLAGWALAIAFAVIIGALCIVAFIASLKIF